VPSNLPTGRCPTCGTYNIVLDAHGNVPKHQIYDREEDRMVTCLGDYG